MDFLKSAVASAIAKGPAFGYSFGDKVELPQSIWTLYNGTKKEDGSRCSIFSFDISTGKSYLPLAKNALRKSRTLRHPGLLKILDTVETDTVIYIATERVESLAWKIKRKPISEANLKWGVYTVGSTLEFINKEASSVHGNIRSSAIFVSESGEWKVGGLEVLSCMKEDDAVIYRYGSILPDSARYAPPEVVMGGWDVIKQSHVSATDSYCYGQFINETYDVAIRETGSVAGVPTKSMQLNCKRLTRPESPLRMGPSQFVAYGLREMSYFAIPLVQLSDGVDNLELQTEEERDEFLGQLETTAGTGDVPEDFLRVKVLPALLKSAEFGGGGARMVSLIAQFSKNLSEEDYNIQTTPVFIRLFQNPDRALRVALLDNLHLMIDFFTNKIVTDKIFPQLVTGFGDVSPVVREQTVKSILVIINKLSDRAINGDLLRHLARTANDEQPGIRTNTTICLGKIAKNLGSGSRTKVLVAAFTRALRDPFVHARNAALLALAATSDLFTDDECATKLLPAICPSLVDKEKLVRDQADKTVEMYMTRVRNFAQTMPETLLSPINTTTSNGPQMSTPQADSTWTGWAISSFTNKLTATAGQIQSIKSPTISTTEVRSSSVPRGRELTANLPIVINNASRPAITTVKSTPNIPRISSSLAVTPTLETPDEVAFGDDWGDMDDEHVDVAWENDNQTRPTSTNIESNIKTSTHTYDDHGEPDFDGWLNAKSQAKKQTNKVLPKGLAKKAPQSAISLPTSSDKSSPSEIGTKQAGQASTKNISGGDDDDWGDAWG